MPKRTTSEVSGASNGANGSSGSNGANGSGTIELAAEAGEARWAGDAGAAAVRVRKGRSPEETLREVQDVFIRRWGEMGATWGINRTQAEIHALLFITGRPQCTDDVMDRLNISRGNASMSLRALCDWGLIRRFHRRGERREYFESVGDVWEMFSIIAAERKRREMDPVLETIRQCQAMLTESEIGKSAARDADVATTRRRLADMGEFMSVTNKIFQQFIANAHNGLNRVAKVLLKTFS